MEEQGGEKPHMDGVTHSWENAIFAWPYSPSGTKIVAVNKLRNENASLAES